MKYNTYIGTDPKTWATKKAANSYFSPNVLIRIYSDIYFSWTMAGVYPLPQIHHNQPPSSNHFFVLNAAVTWMACYQRPNTQLKEFDPASWSTPDRQSPWLGLASYVRKQKLDEKNQRVELGSMGITSVKASNDIFHPWLRIGGGSVVAHLDV